MKDEKNEILDSEQNKKNIAESSDKKNEENTNEIKETNTDNSGEENKIINLIEIVKHIRHNIYNKENEINKNENTKSIIQEYIEDKTILRAKEKLISFIEELSKFLNTGYNIIIPFLDLCPALINSYIESDLDEEEGENELKYIKIFELLKCNSFISRGYLYPIYDYFAHLYYIKDTIQEKDKKLNKFKKVMELWNMIYTFYPENDSQINQEKKKKPEKKNLSTFCFLGSGIKLTLKEKILIEDCLIIDIDFDKNIFFDLNKDLIFVELKTDNQTFKISFADMNKKMKKQEFVIKTVISIIQKKIIFNLFYSDHNCDYLEHNIEYDSFEELIILDNFFGQIENLSINLNIDSKKEDYKYNLITYLLSGNSLYYDNVFIKDISFTKEKLAKVNYINYLDEEFNLDDYFFDFKQFIPFVPLITGLFKNEKIERINGINKQSILIDAFRKIVFHFLSIIAKKKERKKKLKKVEKISSKKNLILLSDKKEENNETTEHKDTFFMSNIQKYDLFAFIIILQLPPELIMRGYLTSDEKNDDFLGKIIKKGEDIFKEDADDFDLIFNGIANAMDEEDFYTDNVDEKKVLAKFVKDLKAANPLLLEYTIKQFYRRIMKELFIYNRLWSIKEFFFSNEYNDNSIEKEYFTKLKLKYKQISYYTKSLEQPILYPILEINEYIPNFSKFDKNKLFRHELNETVDYDFNLKENKIMEYVDNYLAKKGPFFQEKNKVLCCLVKKAYHVKGEMMIKQIDHNFKGRGYCLIFKSYDKEITTTCNKKFEKKKEIKSKMDGLCFGSVFPCPKKEFNRKIVIYMEEINFILIRNYFKSTSAIEIFTNKNKSYYFNFNTSFNLAKNPIIKLFNEIPFFHKLKFNSSKHLSGYCNIKQDNFLFLLLSEELPNSIINNVEYVNLYDLLILINLLSNRSFKDLYQYPVLPTLYNPSKVLEKEKKKERDLSKHLGLQDITANTEKRMKLITESDNDDVENNFDNDNEEEGTQKKMENFLFNIHYSNPTFVCNFLIRIFPYSLTAIELQGDGFDTPNRQFYSLKKSLENNLIQKSDLREFIPEMYYFPELFFNKNNLKLGNLSTGEEINDMYIDNKEEDNYNKYKYLEEFKNYFLNNKSLDISSWIDLIFGINQEMCQEYKREYYSKDKYINLDLKVQKEETNDPYNLQIIEFGIQPLQILDQKFKDLRDVNREKLGDLTHYNLDEFYNDHLIVKNNKEVCFCFEWDGQLKINTYINILAQEQEAEINFNYNYKYRFIGNILGDVFIYKIEKDINDKGNESNNDYQYYCKPFFDKSNKNYKKIIKNQDKIVYDFKKEKNVNEKLIMKLNDHYEEIKYIDYNPRLNMFATYALDGYINIYVFPTYKLVRTIKVKDITKSDDILQKVALISSPFPMIFINDSNFMYSLTINGELITKKEKNKNSKLLACIDKNLGLVGDKIFELTTKGTKNINILTVTLPSLDF